jgi:hypothetical protein
VLLVVVAYKTELRFAKFIRRGHTFLTHETRRCMGQVCRTCESTLVLGAHCTDFSTVIADVQSLSDECAEIEKELYDSFNAFCFKCRTISMSVPREMTAGQQVCYLRSQVTHFQELQQCNLIKPNNNMSG